MDSIERDNDSIINNSRNISNGNINKGQSIHNNSHQSSHAVDKLNLKNKFMLKIQNDLIKINSKVEAFEN